MAWEWVGPVCTSVVGITGVVATMTVSNRAMGVQLRVSERSLVESRRAERLRVYGQYLSAAHNAASALAALTVTEGVRVEVAGSVRALFADKGLEVTDDVDGLLEELGQAYAEVAKWTVAATSPSQAVGDDMRRMHDLCAEVLLIAGPDVANLAQDLRREVDSMRTSWRIEPTRPLATVEYSSKASALLSAMITELDSPG